MAYTLLVLIILLTFFILTLTLMKFDRPREWNFEKNYCCWGLASRQPGILLMRLETHQTLLKVLTAD